jgi:hypothetical protein
MVGASSIVPAPIARLRRPGWILCKGAPTLLTSNLAVSLCAGRSLRRFGQNPTRGGDCVCRGLNINENGGAKHDQNPRSGVGIDDPVGG